MRDRAEPETGKEASREDGGLAAEILRRNERLFRWMVFGCVLVAVLVLWAMLASQRL